MANKTSEHVLASATGLLGFCFVVITGLHVGKATQTSIIDELTSIVSVLLILSCIGSFLAIRANKEKETFPWGKIADYLFVIALIGITGIIVLIAFNFLQ